MPGKTNASRIIDGAKRDQLFSPINYGSIDRSNMLQDENLLETLTEQQGESGNSNTSVNVDVSTYFRDGCRKIDFILVYEESLSSRSRLYSAGSYSGNSVNLSMGGSSAQMNNYAEKRGQKQELWRQKFMANLTQSRLDMEEEIVQNGPKKQLRFIKLHATWPTLCYYAEELNMRAPLQAYPNPSENWSATFLKFLRLPNILEEVVPNEPMNYYTCPFRRSKMDRFLGNEDRDNYFTNVQRARVVYEILSTTVFGKKKKGEIGIDRLVEEGVFLSAFQLHDGPYEVIRKNGKLPVDLNPRQILYEYWARWGKWYKYQPLDHIREYFGEKIAMYFAWLGFYTAWLLPAAFVGVLIFLYGLLTMNNNVLANEVCDSGGEFRMCPLCDEHAGCPYWNLTDVCTYAKIAYLFDHPGTVLYAIFVSFWAVTFLEYWKRKSVSLAHHWDCMGFQEEEERPRPEFAARAPFLEKNPVTGICEPSFPRNIRQKRMAAGIAIIFLMMSIVVIFIVAVIIYRVLVSIPLFQNSTFKSQAQSIANMSGAIVNLILIMTMSRVYEKLAYRLTTWEMHRTQTEFDDNLTFKVFVFQFVNFYSSIFYIAFFKGRFVGYPGNYSRLMELRNEDCSAGGCLIELAQQLAVIMIGKQMINNAQEILVPKLKAWWHKHQTRLPQHRQKTSWEQDYQLIDCEGLFQEYLEMVLQFGFITIFVAAFPLAPLFALLNNWIEIRLDAQKFVCETRRSVAERAENIGIWFKILNMLAHLAVISNGFLIAFTSEFLPKLLYQYEYNYDLKGYVNFTLSYAPNNTFDHTRCRYRGLRDENGEHTSFFWRLFTVRLIFVIIFEHVVFGVCHLIDALVPDIPESLELKIKRERYLAKQALQDSDTFMKVAALDDDGSNNESAPKFTTGRMVLDLTGQVHRMVASETKSPKARAACIVTNERIGKRRSRPKSYSSFSPVEPHGARISKSQSSIQ